MRHEWRSILYLGDFAWESDAALAEAWWAEESAPEGSGLDASAAHDYVEQVHLERGSESFIDILVALADTASDDDALGMLGAGLLEDAVTHWRWARAHALTIEQIARTNERLRRAISGVWLSDRTDPEVLARLTPLGAIDITKPRPERQGG